MSARDVLRVSRRHAAGRKRIRLGQLRARYVFNHGLAFDEFWAEQLFDSDIAAAALPRDVDGAGTAGLEAGRA